LVWKSQTAFKRRLKISAQIKEVYDGENEIIPFFKLLSNKYKEDVEEAMIYDIDCHTFPHTNVAIYNCEYLKSWPNTSVYAISCVSLMVHDPILYKS
jgi:hypothetical protein